MTEQRTGEMEPGHDHRTGVICHLPEELSAQPTGKGVNSQVLKVNYTVSSASVLLLWLKKQDFCYSQMTCVQLFLSAVLYSLQWRKMCIGKICLCLIMTKCSV